MKARLLTRKWPWLSKHKKDKPTKADNFRNIEEQNGLKLLYDAPDAQMDIIAVHGLNGHRERSWTASNTTNWLQSLLPTDIPHARVHTWGYDTPSNNTAPQTSVFQHASKNLVHDVQRMREDTATHALPIIFIAHSQGGTVVKSALLYSDIERKKSESTSIDDRHSVCLATRGVIFIGTPELDSRLNGLRAYLSSLGESGQDEPADLKEARWIVSVLESYAAIADRFITIFVYECLDQKEHHDTWTQTVSESHRLSPHILINSDHGNMIKFGSRTDPGPSIIKLTLKAYIDTIFHSFH
ncbi:hypothetical protein N7532_000288 [Penicillium argentinense]|uniref:DUF676 domain-containing protein n=1 Tax=Penicillium argentinense TaxID=1131581 RepID=A0A9W9KNQ5_9EURO|nr:uncharacterized protein N7532_000288 [Penicillium argentinense]KAJ5112243.1 hypothetical protein N7532_000288 [Penicillium argentinense]